MASSANPTRDDFAALLDEQLGGADGGFEGRVVKGTVTNVENGMVIIDVGLKSEGRVPLKEFAAPGAKPEVKPGDLIELFKTNPLTRAGALEVCGTPIDLKQVTSDIYCVAGTTDHITPWEACYKSSLLFGGKVEFVLSNSGHIQSILNPPGNPKARFVTNSEPAANAREWQEKAAKHADSWWLHWQKWITARSGESKKTPSSLGSKKYPAGEAAPGTYVHER